MRDAPRGFLLRVRWHLAGEEGQLADSPLKLLLLTMATLAAFAAMAMLIAGPLFEALARALG
jgi:hypothetical protein